MPSAPRRTRSPAPRPFRKPRPEGCSRGCRPPGAKPVTSETSSCARVLCRPRARGRPYRPRSRRLSLPGRRPPRGPTPRSKCCASHPRARRRATEKKVSVPAGTKSALGNALAEAKTYSFSTPPPTLKRSYPSDEGWPRDTLMFLEFDQRIDAARVLERLKIEPAAGLRLRAATPEEIAADEELSELVKHAQKGRWLALRAVGAGGATRDALPPDTTVKVVIPPATPSAEGPRVTAAEQSFSFNTYGALRVTQTDCGSDKRCSPFDELTLAFSNQIDEHGFSPSQVKVSPEIPGAKISLAGSTTIQIEGDKRSNTTYTVTLDRAIRDVFGQTLTGEKKFDFKVTTPEPNLFAEGEGFVVLDPAARRAFNVYSVSYRKLKVAVYRVGPGDWQQYRRYVWARRGGGEKNPTPPGTLVFE